MFQRVFVLKPIAFLHTISHTHVHSFLSQSPGDSHPVSSHMGSGELSIQKRITYEDLQIIIEDVSMFIIGICSTIISYHSISISLEYLYSISL